MRLFNVTVMILLAVSGLTLSGFAGDDCCCRFTPADESLCSTGMAHKAASIKPLCCCEFSSSECSVPQTLGTLPAGNIKIEPLPFKTDTENGLFIELPDDYRDMYSSRRAPPVRQPVPDKTPLYILNCSLLR